MKELKELTIGGVAYPIKPLSFKGLREHSAAIKAMGEGRWESPEALFSTMAGIVHASLQRGAPELTFEQVEAELDWESAQPAVEAILIRSFPQAPAGESQVESPSGPSTGTAPSPN